MSSVLLILAIEQFHRSGRETTRDSYDVGLKFRPLVNQPGRICRVASAGDFPARCDCPVNLIDLWLWADHFRTHDFDCDSWGFKNDWPVVAPVSEKG